MGETWTESVDPDAQGRAVKLNPVLFEIERDRDRRVGGNEHIERIGVDVLVQWVEPVGKRLRVTVFEDGKLLDNSDARGGGRPINPCLILRRIGVGYRHTVSWVTQHK